MIDNFNDFCLYIYITVESIMTQIKPLYNRPGPEPKCSDSELITMALVGECKGWDKETELINNWSSHKDLFHNIPSRSRFNRRRRNLMFVINIIRRIILQTLDVAQEKECVIDSLPIPVLQFHLVPASSGNWRAYGATFGKVPSKKITIYGYKLHLLVTIGGVILDFELAPANERDLAVGYELLQNHTDKIVIGDKAYLNALIKAELQALNRIRLITLPRSNQNIQLTKPERHFINSVRQIIETVNGQLSSQFNIETNYAHSFWGLCTRLYTKLTAHTICIYLNRLLGHSNFLQIKHLAFSV